MRFNWKQFLSERSIHYETSGPNTAKGNISIKCPYCGDSDPSEHMGLSLDTGRPFWSCWRSRLHRGRDPSVLVAKLLHLNFEQARIIVQGQGENPDMFEQAVASLAPKEEEAEKVEKKSLTLPKEFREFDLKEQSSTQRRFYNYMMSDRGFGYYTDKLIHTYNLRWCVTGDYTSRIVIPVYHKGELVTWTARAVTPAKIRYKTLEKESEIRNIKDCLLTPNPLGLRFTRDLLVVTEGPFDAMKLEMMGSDRRASAVAVFGLTLSNAQLELLGKMLPSYSQVVILLDYKAESAGAIMADQIKEMWGGNVRAGRLPTGVKDPGDLSRPQAHMLVSQLRRESGNPRRI